MEALTVVMLEHTTREGYHYDLLIEDPESQPTDSRPLWAGRVMVPTWKWSAVGRFEVILLIHHRRRYLAYEGPIGGGRGSVRRVDSGQAWQWTWTGTCRRLEMRMSHFTGLLDLVRLTSDRWQAQARA